MKRFISEVRLFTLIISKIVMTTTSKIESCQCLVIKIT